MTRSKPKPPLIRINAAIFVGLPLAALILVPAWGIYSGFDAFQWLWALAFLYLNGMSITGGYHRLWAHNAYEASPVLKWLFAVWGAGALQNSILIWASDHRRHHRHVDDNELDPYSAGRGLWFSHMGWMLRKYNSNNSDFSNANDLQRDRIVMWQHRHYVALTVFMNVGLPLLLGVWHGDIIGTLLLVGLLRLVINHHVTFFINSLAHFWGSQPYTESNSARDNGILAFVTYGEGYHNFHHIFQTDYRNGIRWWQWDPTKWMISVAAKLGLAHNLNRIPDFRIQRALLHAEFERARTELEQAQNSAFLMEMLEREYRVFTDSINQWTALQAERYGRKKQQLGGALGEKNAHLQQKWETVALRTRLRELEYSLKMQRKRVGLLVQQLQLQGHTRAGVKVGPARGVTAMKKTRKTHTARTATLRPRFRRSYRRPAALALLITALALAACSDNALLPINAGYGPNPTLPAPQEALIPTVHIADAHGWPVGQTPQVTSGLQIRAFASGLGHPRWLYTLPNGDVLVAETDAPPKPEDGKGLRGWIMGLVMKKAGSGHPSANRITLLRDTDSDGVADVRTVFIDQLNSPFGMVLVGQHLYVAATDAVLVFPYREGATRIDALPQQLLALPGGPINHHWTKNIIANADGSKLYVTVGSNSNVGENGMAAEQGRAAIWEINSDGSGHREFATGLRNPNGMAWEAESKVLWTVVNERDELGGDLVPDYLTSVRDGGFYGWPYSYYGQHVDTRVQPQQPTLVARALVPDYALGSHTASLGLAASDGQTLAPRYAHGMFIGQHGSWNRKPRSGYKVVFVPFDGAMPSGQPVDVVTGFLHDDQAYGRPVGVALDKSGALLVADDVGNTVWRVSAAAR